jgi:hypothetical protein
MRKVAMAGACVLAIFAIGACGGDDDEDTTAADTTAATEEEFTAQVTEACDAAGAEILGTQEALQEALASGDIDSVVQEELIPLYEGLLADLEAITPPEELADTYDQYLASVNESVDLLEENAGELFEASTGGENEVTQQADALEQETDQLGAELGIPETCGEGTSTGATGAEGAG